MELERLNRISYLIIESAIERPSRAITVLPSSHRQTAGAADQLQRGGSEERRDQEEKLVVTLWL